MTIEIPPKGKPEARLDYPLFVRISQERRRALAGCALDRNMALSELAREILYGWLDLETKKAEEE